MSDRLIVRGTVRLGDSLGSLSLGNNYHVRTGDTFTVTGTPTVTATVQGVSDTAVYGTGGNDAIVLSPVGNSGTVSVKLNGKLIGTYTPTGTINVIDSATASIVGFAPIPEPQALVLLLAAAPLLIGRRRRTAGMQGQS